MSTNKRVLVLGMAKSGYEAAKLLINKGYKVILNDINAEQNISNVKELEALGVKVILGSHPSNLINDSISFIVKNPGIKNTHSFITKAIKLNISVINELELAYRYIPKSVKIIGVTGSNGKTTTSAIIYKMLKKEYKRVFLMGNIGDPVCSFVDKLQPKDMAVIEVSDHQLCNVRDFKSDISVLTNIYEAHIDFHGSYNTYKNIKKRIFNHHNNNHIAILNRDNAVSIELTNNINSVKKYFSYESQNVDCYVNNGFIYYKGTTIIDLNDIKLKGNHNYENIMAAIMVVKELNVKNSTIVNVLKNFTGFEHRIEYVRSIKGVDFYNDSKSTNITATKTALISLKKPTILLLGGFDRGHSFNELKAYLNNVKLIVAYGEVKKRVKVFAEEVQVSCKVVIDLKEATNCAYNSACVGDVVLLSPACASWDQFENYEVRGNLFKKYVNQLS